MEVTANQERGMQNTKAIDMLTEAEDLGAIHASRIRVSSYR